MTDTPKFYTTTGDDGTTGLIGDERVKKYHPRPEAIGSVDETQAALGMARAVMQDKEAAQVVLQAQRDLYHLMAELSATKEVASRFSIIDAQRVVWLESQTDHYGEQITLPREFVVSGDSVAGAALDFARTVARRAERRVFRIYDDGLIDNPDLARYLNRLSSLLFVLARYEDALSGQSMVTVARVPPRNHQ